MNTINFDGRVAVITGAGGGLGRARALLLAQALPERVAAGVAFLASEACGFTGQILAAGAGYFSTVRLVEGKGLHAPAGDVTPEYVAAHWAEIADESGARGFDSATEALLAAFAPTRPS